MPKTKPVAARCHIVNVVPRIDGSEITIRLDPDGDAGMLSWLMQPGKRNSDKAMVLCHGVEVMDLFHGPQAR